MGIRVLFREKVRTIPKLKKNNPLHPGYPPGCNISTLRLFSISIRTKRPIRFSLTGSSAGRAQCYVSMNIAEMKER